MNKDRAREILESPAIFNVTYNGTPVYIENVNENAGTASIHFRNQPKKSREVSIEALQEH
jgi:small acid-soluble spore protein H (minor)